MKPSEEDKKKTIQFYGKFAGLAIEMFLFLLIAAFAGQWLDEKFELPKPYLTVLLILIALGGVFYKMIKDLSKK